MSIISTVTFNVFNSFVYVVTEPSTFFGKSGKVKTQMKTNFLNQPCFKCVKKLVMITKTVHKHEVIMCLWSWEHS